MSEKLSRTKLYSLLDYHPERKTAVGGAIKGQIMAKYSGEKRCPKKGEWYLSGAIIGAYKAFNDLSTPYHIAKLVRVTDVRQVVDYEPV